MNIFAKVVVVASGVWEVGGGADYEVGKESTNLIVR